ncbi:LysR family transcriptional regulator [soil metagenome]
MDQFDAMRAFVAVATWGSFAEAARRLRISPSAVTRSVAQLEDRLGLTLLNRTTRSVRLTERGQIYLGSSRRILEDLEAGERQARGENAEPRGVLHVAAPIVFGRLHVLPMVGRLLVDHPSLTVRLSLSDRNVHLVEDGVDAALRIGALADSSLTAVKLGSVSRVLVASPTYLADRGSPSSLANLEDHALIAFEGLEVTDAWRFSGADVRVTPRLSVNSADTAIAAAEAGLGITRALSYQVRAAIQAGRLVPLLQDYAPPAMPVSVVSQARRLGSANVAAFVAAARDHLRTHPLTAV